MCEKRYMHVYKDFIANAAYSLLLIKAGFHSEK